MNFYEQQGIVKEVAAGRHIIICASRSYASYMFGEIAAAFPEPPDHVMRENGKQRITHNGGSVSFAHSPDGLRGREADRVLFSMRVGESKSFMEEWFANAKIITHRIEPLSG